MKLIKIRNSKDDNQAILDKVQQALDEETPDMIDTDEEHAQRIEHLSRVRVEFDDDPDFMKYILYVDGKKIDQFDLYGKTCNWEREEQRLYKIGMDMIGPFQYKAYPIYMKSALGTTFYKILDAGTIVTSSYGSINLNHFRQFTIQDMVKNPNGEYAKSSKAEWEASLPEPVGVLP